MILYFNTKIIAGNIYENNQNSYYPTMMPKDEVIVDKYEFNLNILKSTIKSYSKLDFIHAIFNIEVLNSTHEKEIKDLILRFKQNNIRRYANENFKNVMQITGKAGDLIIVDTSGIHRGSPIKNGKRIALTNYLNHKPFSKGITDQLVK